MLIRRIKDITDLTAEKLSADPLIVEVIIKYYFWWIRQRLEDVKYAAIHVPFLGVFYLSKANLHYALTNYIRHIRRGKNVENFKKYFRVLWNARHNMMLYYVNNKNKKSKKYEIRES